MLRSKHLENLTLIVAPYQCLFCVGKTYMYISALLIPEDDIANGFTCIDFSTMNRHKNDMVIKRLSHLPFVFYSLFVNVHIKQCHIQFLRL